MNSNNQTLESGHQFRFGAVSASRYHEYFHGRDLVTMGWGSLIGSNMYSSQCMALLAWMVPLASCSAVPQPHRHHHQQRQQEEAPLHYWAAPSIPLYWILGGLSESRPKPKLPVILGNYWTSYYLHEQKPSKPVIFDYFHPSVKKLICSLNN